MGFKHFTVTKTHTILILSYSLGLPDCCYVCIFVHIYIYFKCLTEDHYVRLVCLVIVNMSSALNKDINFTPNNLHLFDISMHVL